MEKQTFIERNKVFLIGLAASLAVILQQFLATPEVNWRAVGIAAGIGILSYVANEWRGQGITILGVISTLAGTFVSIHNTGNFSWNQFLLAAGVALLSAVAPPPKLKEYENSAPIVEAKKEAVEIKELKK